jgi:hypothetical protein
MGTLCGVLSAQESLLGRNTFGLFTGDIDNYMDVNSYGDVAFEKGFGFIGAGRVTQENYPVLEGGDPLYASNDEGTGVSGGFAFKLKGIYLGAFADTNFWHGRREESTVGGKRDDKNPVTGNTDDPGVTFDGRFDVIAGINPLLGAFKLGLDIRQWKNDYDEYPSDNGLGMFQRTENAEGGKLIVDLNWGNNFALGEHPITPHVRVGLDAPLNQIDEVYSGDPASYHNIRPGYIKNGIPFVDENPEDVYMTQGAAAPLRFVSFSSALAHVNLNLGAGYRGFNLDYGISFGFLPDGSVKIEPDGTYFYDPDTGVSTGQDGASLSWKGYDVIQNLGFSYSRTFPLVDQRLYAGWGGGVDMGLQFYQTKYTIDHDKKADVEKRSPQLTEFYINPHAEVAGIYTFSKIPLDFQVGLQLRSNTKNAEGLPQNVSYFYKVRGWESEAEAKGTDYVKSVVQTFSPLGVDMGLGFTFKPFSMLTFDVSCGSSLIDTLFTEDFTFHPKFNLVDWSQNPFDFSVTLTYKK